MRKLVKTLIGGLFAFSLMIGISSCENKKAYSDMTPEQQEQAYAKFQKDSLELCTKDARMAEAAVLRAFDAVPENNGYWKKDKVTVDFDPSIQKWVGVVTYHYDRNNVYYQSTKTFYVKYWYEMVDGNPSNGRLFYSISSK